MITKNNFNEDDKKVYQTDLIYRSDAIEAYNDAMDELVKAEMEEFDLADFTECEFNTTQCKLIARKIESVPTVEPKQGEWQVRFPYKDTGKIRTCSNCNVTQTVNVYEGKVRFRFCPYCGARMKRSR